ncbi:MAG: sensor histidine kinase [Hyphomicrobiaceae bacterium]
MERLPRQTHVPAAPVEEPDRRTALAGGKVRPGVGLPAKLLILTIIFVMVAEVMVFVPSIANFRLNWLNDRLMAAELASMAAAAAPERELPPTLREALLRSAQVKAIAIKRMEQRSLILSSQLKAPIELTFDLREQSMPRLVWDAIGVFLQPEDRLMRVIGDLEGRSSPGRDSYVEVVLPVGPMKAAMTRYSLTILLLSVVISIFTAGLVYLALHRLLVRPMMAITRNMLRFSENPEDASRIITPSRRDDEIGTAERELEHMQRQLVQLLQQKNRLAALGLAVSKINHDLRNMLSSAQLISDRLASLPDPTVQRFAPKLIGSLDRAIKFCNDTLKFGKAAESDPRREVFALALLVTELADGLGLPDPARVDWVVEVEPSLMIDADRDQLYRVLSNVCRNALEAIEAQSDAAMLRVTAQRERRRVTIDVRDTGPGIPARVREDLFLAFRGSNRKGGTGLGLAIAAEIVTAHGGTIRLVESAQGTHFRIEIPDRSVTS